MFARVSSRNLALAQTDVCRISALGYVKHVHVAPSLLNLAKLYCSSIIQHNHTDLELNQQIY